MASEFDFSEENNLTRIEAQKQAVLYRMVTSQKICVHGLKAKDLLKRNGYRVDDRHLKDPDAIQTFKKAHNVPSLPQVFIENKAIGGFDELCKHFGVKSNAENGTTYKPIIALFAIAGFLAFNTLWLGAVDKSLIRFIELFVSISMVLLGLQKLQDIERFATMFLNYDLLAQRWVRYAYIYPFIETLAGLLMMVGAFTIVMAPIALIAASIGALSVFKAVYIDKRDLKCACVGGDSKVPLGFISLLENIMMLAMASWMLTKLL